MKYGFTPEVAEIARRQSVALRRVTRSFEALRETTMLTNHRIVSEFGRQWEHPEAVLSDSFVEYLEARSLGRTLAEIDELPTTQ